MKEKRGIFNRLDTRLTAVIAGILILWLMTLSFGLIYVQNNQRTMELQEEKTRVVARIQRDNAQLLNDIVLSHDSGLRLLIQDIANEMNLYRIELTKIDDGTRYVAIGAKYKDSNIGQNEALAVRSAIEYQGKSYGSIIAMVSLSERSAISHIFIVIWFFSCLVVILIFFLVRHFISKQIIDPIGQLISGFWDVETLSKTTAQNSSYEIDALRRMIMETQKLYAQYQEKSLEKRRTDAIAKLAAQVAHDILSPLAALTMVEKDLSQLPEETRVLIRSAVGRIRDIANHLLESNRTGTSKVRGLVPIDVVQNEPSTTQLLSSIVEGIVTEKRMQFRSKIGIKIEAILDSSSYGTFVTIQLTEFKRVLSNLVNNSVEALLNDKGKVTLTLDIENLNKVKICVQDNGKGIPPEILVNLGQHGATHDKQGGSGLGLHHAKTSVESWGGKLEIKSEFGIGTTVILTLPRAEAPSWFIEELLLESNSVIVVLDDDESIHRIWEGRAESAKLNERGIQLVHLSTPAELRTWNRNTAGTKKAVRYLVDFELLGFNETGLDLIEELGISAHSILVTSRFEEPIIRERCIRLKVLLMPKSIAGFVPIVMKENFDLIVQRDKNLHYNISGTV